MRLSRSFIGALFVFAAVTFSLGSGGEKVPAEWRQRYRQVQNLVNRKDKEGFFALLDTSFVQVDQRGRCLPYEIYVRNFPAFFDNYDSLKTQLRATSCHTTGDEAVLTYEFRVYGMSGNRITADYIEMGTDTWRKIHGKYLLVKEVVQSLAPIPTK